MIRIHMNIICMNISALTEYKQSYLWWELHWCQSKEKNNSTVWTPWCWRGKHSAQSPRHTVQNGRDSTNCAYWTTPKEGVYSYHYKMSRQCPVADGCKRGMLQPQAKGCRLHWSVSDSELSRSRATRKHQLSSINITLLGTEVDTKTEENIYSFLFSRVKTILRIYFLVWLGDVWALLCMDGLKLHLCAGALELRPFMMEIIWL